MFARKHLVFVQRLITYPHVFKYVFMKKYYLALIYIFLVQLSFSQIIIDKDGLYYNEDNELFTGSYVEFYDNGNKKIELDLKDGKKDGKVFLYFENSEINEMRSYKEGLKHGLWETWNENKIKIAEANFNNNLKHGKWIIWDNNGVKRCEMYYVEGKKSGTWYMWDENDKLINKKEY